MSSDIVSYLDIVFLSNILIALFNWLYFLFICCYESKIIKSNSIIENEKRICLKHVLLFTKLNYVILNWEDCKDQSNLCVPKIIDAAIFKGCDSWKISLSYDVIQSCLLQK